MEARDGTFILLPLARQDLLEIGEFLGARDKARAARWFEMARQTFDELAQSPFLGALRPQTDARLHSIRAWRVKEFRAYLIFYRPLASGDGVVIHRVTHNSREVLPLLEASLEE